MQDQLRIAVAESIGTAVLVIGGCGTALYSTVQPISVGVAGVATAFGLSLLIMAYTIGPISGCHINPAVTLAMVVAGKTKAAMAPAYVVGQLIGGLAGGLALRAVFRASNFGAKAMGDGAFASNGYGAHSPLGFKLVSVAIVEIGLTALLGLVVLGTTHAKFVSGFGGLAVGAALWLIHLISIPIDNTSVNPARSLGVAPFAYESWPLQQVWAFIVFPLVGGAVGGLLWRFISGPDAAGVDRVTVAADAVLAGDDLSEAPVADGSAPGV